MHDPLAELQQKVRAQEAQRLQAQASGKRLCKKCEIYILPDSPSDYCTVCNLKKNQARWRRY